MNYLKFENVYIGQRVIFKDVPGIIIECKDPHNILIHFDDESHSIICIEENCEEFEELYPFLDNN